MQLYHGEALATMDKLIADGIIVDAIITDPPYGTTACKWDSIIPFDEMWLRLNKLIKPNGAIVLFGSEPFSSMLICSNLKYFKYSIIWKKERPTNFMMAKKQIMKYHENICIFYKKQGTFIPQMQKRKQENKRKNKPRGLENKVWNIENKGAYSERVLSGTNDLIYPNSILEFNMERGLHPTQKPVALMEYLIKTYTNEGELVLDFTMGSFTTAIACLNTKRSFIGIELDENYFKIGTERLEKHLETLDYTPKISYNV